MKDVFGTDRGGCMLVGPSGQGCSCGDFCALRDAMTEEQRREEGAFVACQRASELFLTCTCGHPAHQHAPRSGRKTAEPGAQAGTTVHASAGVAKR